MAFHTDRIRQTAVKVSAWISRTDAPMAEDSRQNEFLSGPISDESDNRAASALDRVYLLRISRDALNGWLRDPITRDVPRLFHILPLIVKRNQCISAHCVSVYVRVLGTYD